MRCPISRCRRETSGTAGLARFVVDTDVFIDHLRAARRMPVAPHDAAYSSITRAELYAGKSADEAVIDLLLAAFEQIPVTRDIAEQGGRIRRAVSISLPDALLAATAILNGSVLVTRNVGHFERVAGLQLDARCQSSGHVASALRSASLREEKRR